MLEVLRTQGLWAESLRLAFLQTIKGAVAVLPSPDSPQDAEAGLKRCPAPTYAQLQVSMESNIEYFASVPVQVLPQL